MTRGELQVLVTGIKKQAGAVSTADLKVNPQVGDILNWLQHRSYNEPGPDFGGTFPALDKSAQAAQVGRVAQIAEFIKSLLKSAPGRAQRFGKGVLESPQSLFRGVTGEAGPEAGLAQRIGRGTGIAGMGAGAGYGGLALADLLAGGDKEAAWQKGFLAKCAEMGVDPNLLIQQ
jgi:hypothetical protein